MKKTITLSSLVCIVSMVVWKYQDKIPFLSRVINETKVINYKKKDKETSNIDYDKGEFYLLKKLGDKQQPKGSKVCWAVCLANILEGIYPDRNITFCDILGSKDSKCFYASRGGSLRINGAFNRTSDPEDLVKEAKKYDINLVPYALKQFSSFDTIVNFLNTQKAPIIFQSKHDNQTHLQYVSGYGTRKGCQYFYVFDPEKGDDDYIPVLAFLEDIQNNEILRAWHPIPLKKNKAIMKPNKKLQKYMDTIQQQITMFHKNNPNLIHISAYDDPLYYLSFPEPDISIFKEDNFFKAYYNKVSTDDDLCDDDPISIRDRDITDIDKKLKALYLNQNINSLFPKTSTFYISDNNFSLQLVSEGNTMSYMINTSDTLQKQKTFTDMPLLNNYINSLKQ